MLLQQAVEDRDALHWDFAFVLTAAELSGSYSTYCFAALSRPLDAAVFSLSRIDPRTSNAGIDDETRISCIGRRLSRLMLHALGHLTGLPRDDRSDNLLFHPSLVDDLDAMESLTEQQRDKQRLSFSEIADLRLEEGVGRRMSSPAFVMRAAWINRMEIIEAIHAARPWQFPKRLSRLTIASVSTLAILLLTAEAWDLGMSQTLGRIATLSMLSLLVTTIYVVLRQQLLIRRGRRRSEQTVVTSASALGIVFLGMLTTWLALLLIGVVIGSLLFHPKLIASWAESTGLEASEIGLLAIVQMSIFVASVGLLIGALGASIETQNYFRHVIFVDEEI